MPSVKSAIKPFVDEFEKIGSQTASQGVSAVKQVASDVIQKPVQEAAGSPPPSAGNRDIGTNEDQQGTQQQLLQQQIAKAKQDDAQKTQANIAQIKQNLKALMTPKQKPPDKPIYYKMWEDMEKKKEERQEEN